MERFARPERKYLYINILSSYETTPSKQNPAIARVKKKNNFNTIRNVPRYNKLQYIVIEILETGDENDIDLESGL